MGCAGSSAAETKSQPKPSDVPTPTTNANPAAEQTGAAASTQPVTNTDSASNTPVNWSTEVQHACFGAGCYWGTEKYFRHLYPEKYPQRGKILSGHVGFMGPEGAPENPTYREVCSGKTGHVEVYHFDFEGGNDYYEDLVRFFFQFHDPTTSNRQGNDKGTQYASVIYYYSEEQRVIAERIKEELQSHLDCGNLKCYQTKVVTTDIRPATVFYAAHDEHQDYLTVNPNGYCNHRLRFKEWPKPYGSS